MNSFQKLFYYQEQFLKWFYKKIAIGVFKVQSFLLKKFFVEEIQSFTLIFLK